MRDGLDQFYTQPEIAEKCFANIQPVIQNLNIQNPFYIEPGAGDGAFFDVLPDNRKIGFDIEPKHKNIIKKDFLNEFYISPKNKFETIIIGNPPFGLRGKMALNFMNRGFEIADTVAFIVPVIFRKYFIHKNLPENVAWIYSFPLPRYSFRKLNKDYAVNTEFQLWTRIPNKYQNKRLFNPPKITHPDFEIYQYNNTKDALKVFKNRFDFAVPCQGYQDYSRRETNQNKCEKNKQWMLFKAKNKNILTRIYNMDFETLSTKYITTIPGFRKGDVVGEYSQNYQ